MRFAFSTVSILIGCVVGYFSAHHFALFGGIMLLGEPYSPARDQLVPGHMVLWAVLFVIAEWAVGTVYQGCSRLD